MQQWTTTNLQFPATITVENDEITASYDDTEAVLDYCTVIVREAEELQAEWPDGTPYEIKIPQEDEIDSDLWQTLRDELAEWVAECTGLAVDSLRDNQDCPEPYLEATLTEKGTVTRIYRMVDSESTNGEQEEYAAYLRAALAAEYPMASVEIETTTTESGDLPCIVEADTWGARVEAETFLARCWEEYCQQ